MPHHTRTPWTMRKLERRASRAGDVSAATKAARRWASSRSGSRQTPPAWPRSSRGDGRTAVLRTSARAADVVAGPWHRERAAGGLQAVLGAVKHRRRGLGAREATGGPWECGLLRRAADVVSCLGSSATKVGEEQQPGHANRHKRATYDDRRLQRQPKPPLWPAGTLGCKKRAKRQPQREVLTTRLCHQEL